MARIQLHEDDHEDIRFAVVMNGGVSLAVWIGGVTLELNRLTNSRAGQRGVYGELLDLVQGSARVDVISGTSAGGINGAFLALAAVYGQDLSSLGALWARRGSLDELFRSPMERHPPSLMRGDGYFLPALAEAFREVLPADPDASYRPPDVAPIDLTITSSILAGERRFFVDDFGTRIGEVDHHGRFTFRRGATTPVDGDPFRHPRITAQLALAARSTASFPFAFEASWCPVGEAGDALHPDMAGLVNFGRSRYLVDGGVLLNKPVAPALASIRAQPASKQVRRILAYVNPNPGAVPLTQEPDDREPGPGLPSVVVGSLFTLPQAQSIDAALTDLQQRNEQARDRRESRLALVAHLGEHADPLARDLYDAYQLVRRRRAAAAIGDLVQEAAAQQPSVAGSAQPAPSWTREDIVAAVGRVKALPFVPAAELAAAADPAGGWDWGLAVVERLGFLAVDVLRRAMWVAPLGTRAEPHPARLALRDLRGELHARLEELRGLRADDSRFWREEAVRLPAPPEHSSGRPEVLDAWALQACERWATSAHPGRAGELGLAVASVLVRAREACATLPAAEDRTWARDDRVLLEQLLAALVPHADAAACLPRLLHTEVVTLVLAVSRQEGDQAVDLMQISGNGTNSFNGPESATKLAGVQLGHFGAFYKESWRVNDWVWGRIDGASRAVQAVLAPARLRQLRYGTDEAYAEILALATGGPDRDELVDRFEEQRCRDELTYLDDDTRPMPPSLPVCAMAVARRLHLEILRESLGTLARAVDTDERAGAVGDTPGGRFRDAYRDAHRTFPAGQPGAEVFRLFKEAAIGGETVHDDVGSELFARTVSTAAAVTTSTLSGDQGGSGPLRAVARVLRGVVLLLYAMVLGTTRGGTGAAAVTVTLGIGGACLALFLLTRATPPLVPFIGFIVLLAGLAHASLRGKLKRQGSYLLAGLVVTILLGVLLAWLVPAVSVQWRALVENVLVLAGVVVLVLGAMGLGGIYDRGAGPVEEPAPDARV